MKSMLLISMLAAGGVPNAALDAALKKGLTQYAQGEWRGAIKTLRALAPRLVDGPKRAAAYLHLGLAQVELKQFRFAEDAFALALTADPLVDADVNEHPPRAVALFRATRDRLDGTLNVQVNGPASRIIIDGVDRGPSPLSLKLRVGRHSVRVESIDGKHHAPEQSLVVRIGQAESLTLTMIPRPASVPDRHVSTNPALSPKPVPIDQVLPPTATAPEIPPTVVATRVWPPLPRKTRPWGWALTGTAVAMLTTGAILFWGAKAPAESSRETYNSAVAPYNTRIAWGGGLLIGGAATGLGAAVLFALHRGRPPSGVSFSLPQSSVGPLAGVAVAIHR